MRITSLIIGMLLPVMAMAQTTKDEIAANPNKAGGVYYAYPVTESANTPAPKDFEPFYISHYGRHGSRYLISDRDYEWVLQTMRKAHKAGALTSLGEGVLNRLEKVWEEAEGRGGDLSPLGVRQHRGIAERMYRAFPQVFKGEVEISARSTIVMRCAMSMDAFCERLKELNPSLKITREASQRYMCYMNFHSQESNRFTGEGGPWHEEYRKFYNEHTHGENLTKSLFSDAKYVRKNINPDELIWGFYWIAVDMQDMETKVSFFDLFTTDELWDLWQAFNYRFYVCDANYAGNHGLMLDNAKPLLRNILESAEQAVANTDKTGATLRFGHDGNLIPLAGLLHLKDCYNSVMDPEDFPAAFADFKISPMAGNVQIVFFRNKKQPSEVIVKFLHNERETSIPIETDIYPFYHWNDVKAYWKSIL